MSNSPQPISAFHFKFGRHGKLISRNVTVCGHRTSMRLEPEMWDAFHEISACEQMSINELCSLIKTHINDSVSLTASVRVFVMNYYRQAAKSISPLRTENLRNQLGETAMNPTITERQALQGAANDLQKAS